MKKEQRIKKLEEDISKTYVDPSLDTELTEWLKLNAGYNSFAQTENNNGIIMPEHLNIAFSHRMEKLFAEKNIQPNLSSLLKIYKEHF